jgi:hypothetical protein
MQGDDRSSSGFGRHDNRHVAATAAAAGAAGEIDDDGDGSSLLSDDGAGDGRLWFVGERIGIADVAVADLVSCGCINAAAVWLQGNMRTWLADMEGSLVSSNCQLCM